MDDQNKSISSSSRFLDDKEAVFFKKSRKVDSSEEIQSSQTDFVDLSKTFHNKALSRVRDQERRKLAMNASPSIMNTKQKQLSSNNRPKFEKSDLKDDINNIFENLKSSSNSVMMETGKKSPNSLPGPNVTANTSPAVSDKTVAHGDSPTVEKIEPTPEWAKIDLTAIARLKENANNFRYIVEELKKAK